MKDYKIRFILDETRIISIDVTKFKSDIEIEEYIYEEAQKEINNLLGYIKLESVKV